MNCPVCGTGRLDPHEVVATLTVPYGPTLDVPCNDERCDTCGMNGDFSELNDARFKAALAIAVRESVATMLDDLASMGFTTAYLERALGLYQRTLTEWRAGECPPAGAALLRIVRTYPWIVTAAEAGFQHPAAAELPSSPPGGVPCAHDSLPEDPMGRPNPPPRG